MVCLLIRLASGGSKSVPPPHRNEVAEDLRRLWEEKYPYISVKVEKTISELGAEAVDFLLSLDPEEIQLLVARSVEAIRYQRSKG